MTPSPLDCALWNVFHDGCVETIDGSPPGDVRLGIAIDYLRKRFPDPGILILVTLHQCTKLEFLQDEEAEAITDPRRLLDPCLEIMGSEVPGEVSCFTFQGTYVSLSLAAAGYSLALDSGREIRLDELTEVAREYWDSFGREAKG